MSSLLKIKANIRARAKLNLCLHVDGKLGGGYHAIRSVICPIDLCDNLEVSISKSLNANKVMLNTSFSKKLLSHHDNVILEEVRSSKDNFVLQIINKFLEKFKISPHEIIVNLEKNIPMQAGLGGGTADAGAVLNLLCEYFEVDSSSKDVLDLAASVGSDVVAQMQNALVYAYSKGEKSIPLKIDSAYVDFLRTLNLLIVKPKSGSNTKFAYQSLKKETINSLFENELSKSFFSQKDFSNWKNDFEEVLLEEYAEIKAIFDTLETLGARKIILAGSGSSVVGIFKSKLEQKILDSLNEDYFCELTTFSV